MNPGLTASALGAVLGSGLIFGMAVSAQQQPAVPDAPAPQKPAPLGDLTNGVTPGMGSRELHVEFRDRRPISRRQVSSRR